MEVKVYTDYALVSFTYGRISFTGAKREIIVPSAITLVVVDELLFFIVGQRILLRKRGGQIKQKQYEEELFQLNKFTHKELHF
jgi:hypothetical protein